MATRKSSAPSKIAKASKKTAAPARTKAVAKKPVAEKAPAGKTVAKKAVVKKATVGKVVKPATRTATTSKRVRTPVAKKKSAAMPRAGKKISADQAMANTLALLKAKNEKARQPPNYPTSDPVHPGAHGPQVVDAAQPETAPTERLTEAIHGHAYATERGDGSKRGQG